MLGMLKISMISLEVHIIWYLDFRAQILELDADLCLAFLGNFFIFTFLIV